LKIALLRVSLLMAVLLLAVVMSLLVGAAEIRPLAVLQSLWSDMTDEATRDIIWRLRAPRILLALLIGAGLGCAGAGYQGLFRNALADPFVIGASSGAALGATVALVRGWHGYFFGVDLISVAALGGSLLVVATVYAIASTGRETPTLALLLAGIAVSSFVGALVSLMMFMNNEQLSAIFGWLMGSLSGRSWPAVQSAVPLLALGMGLLWLLSRPLDCLAFGDETAASLGMDLARMRGAIVLAASIATAAAVAAAGIIGFVGLIAPHLARLFMGTARHAIVIPISGLTGGILLLSADTTARTLAAPGELPVGVITALLGAPFFLYLLRNRRHELERKR
jgi:iron complex transport system permease protein